MNITFYQNKSDNIVVNKNLEEIITIDAKPYGNINVETPSFLLDLHNDIANANYVYVEEFQRYYFVDTRELLQGGKTLIKCHVDLLYTFRRILTDPNSVTTCIATRSNFGNKYINDPMVLYTKRVKRQVMKIGTPFTKLGKFVIQIGG